MHDQDVCSLRELEESGVGTGLIGAEYDRHVPCLHAVRQSREIAVRYSQGSHGHSLPVEHCRRFCFRHINDADIETNASSRLARRSTQRRTEHLKCAILLIEEATEERRKAWCHVLPEGPAMGNESLRA
jgi:hypothetical protein